MEYIEIKDNIIIAHFCAQELPIGSQYREVYDSFNGSVGDNINLFDWNNQGEKKSDSELITQGLVEDHRGTYYDKATKESFELTEIGVISLDTWTNIEPDSKDRFQTWDETQNIWVIDESAKQKAQIERQLFGLKQQLSDGDYKVIKAFELNTTLEMLYPGEPLIRQTLRDEINVLEINAVKE